MKVGKHWKKNGGGVFDADNWNISFLTTVGNDNGITVNYGQDIKGIKVFEDWEKVVTKICPVGFDGLLLPEKYLIADVQYQTPYTKTISFDTDLEIEDQTEANLITELRTKAQNYLNENKYPKVSYEVESNVNENMNMGDTIHVKHPLVTILTEVIEYEYNTNTKKTEKLIFGNYVKDAKSKFSEYKENVKKIEQHSNKQDSVISKQTELINKLGKEGYIYWDDNELLVMDARTKSTAVNLWRLNLGGFGFSDNGYEGPFKVAMTMDGQINADMITTGKLNVARIEGLNEYKKENLLLNSNFSADNTDYVNWSNSGSNSSFVREIVTNNNKNWIHLQNDDITINLHGIKQNGISKRFKSNTKYTVSFLAYGSGSVSIGIQQKLNNTIVETEWKTFELINEVKKYKYTFTSSSSNINKYTFLLCGKEYEAFNFYVTEIKFEEGEYETNWNDNIADHITSSINLNSDGILIDADQINLTSTKVINVLAGSTINLTSKNIAISSTNFSVTRNGILTCNSAVFNNVTLTSESTDSKYVFGSGFIKFVASNGNRRIQLETRTVGFFDDSDDSYIGGIYGIRKADGIVFSGNQKLDFKINGSTKLDIDGSSINSRLDITRNGYGRFVYSRNTHLCTMEWTSSGLQFWVDTTNVGTLSDRRLKEDISNVDENLIKAIDECNFYQYKAKNRGGLISVGIMAQDLTEKFQKYGIEDSLKYEVLRKIQYKLDDKERYYSINYDQLLAFKILALEKRIKELEKVK